MTRDQRNPDGGWIVIHDKPAALQWLDRETRRDHQAKILAAGERVGRDVSIEVEVMMDLVYYPRSRRRDLVRRVAGRLRRPGDEVDRALARLIADDVLREEGSAARPRVIAKPAEWYRRAMKTIDRRAVP